MTEAIAGSSRAIIECWPGDAGQSGSGSATAIGLVDRGTLTAAHRDGTTPPSQGPPIRSGHHGSDSGANQRRCGGPEDRHRTLLNCLSKACARSVATIAFDAVHCAGAMPPARTCRHRSRAAPGEGPGESGGSERSAHRSGALRIIVGRKTRMLVLNAGRHSTQHSRAATDESPAWPGLSRPSSRGDRTENGSGWERSPPAAYAPCRDICQRCWKGEGVRPGRGRSEMTAPTVRSA